MRIQPKLILLMQEFSVCQIQRLTPQMLEGEYCFAARTPDEISLVCPSSIAPECCTAREDGWRCLCVNGPLDFSLTGILAGIAGALAAANVPVFAVSTFDTDYILLKAESIGTGVRALEAAGYTVIG